MRKFHAMLISLILVLFLANNITFFTVQNIERETVTISRVIDGDTLELADGRTIRLANINSPEKNSPLSKSAIDYLKKYENKSVEIEILEEDRYNRFVSRVFSPDYVNENLVSLGFALKAWVFDSETREFARAEKAAITEGKGIWQHSQYWECLKINIEPQEEIARIDNSCSSNLQGFYIKDESRKIYKFLNIQEGITILYTADGKSQGSTLYWNAGNVWNNDRDAAYVFDNEDKIAGYYSYGY